MAKQAFWAEDMKELLGFTSGLLPSTAKDLPSNLNAITRLSLVICLLLAFWNPQIAIVPFVLVLVFTMAIYYCNHPREGYNNDFLRPRLLPNDLSQYVSHNQLLVGGPNPKTMIPVMDAMKIRSHDHEIWKNTSLSVRSDINDSSIGKPINNRVTILNYGQIFDCEKFPDVKLTDVVDPRFTGYGPTDRCRIDPKDGSRKYIYDDVDAVRMPNYISRNNIDIYPWAPRYGSSSRVYSDDVSASLAAENRGYLDVKQSALDAFTYNTGRARSELQESLMMKRNGEMWQRRIAPIH